MGRRDSVFFVWTTTSPIVPLPRLDLGTARGELRLILLVKVFYCDLVVGWVMVAGKGWVLLQAIIQDHRVLLSCDPITPKAETQTFLCDGTHLASW